VVLRRSGIQPMGLPELPLCLGVAAGHNVCGGDEYSSEGFEVSAPDWDGVRVWQGTVDGVLTVVARPANIGVRPIVLNPFPHFVDAIGFWSGPPSPAGQPHTLVAIPAVPRWYPHLMVRRGCPFALVLRSTMWPPTEVGAMEKIMVPCGAAACSLLRPGVTVNSWDEFGGPERTAGWAARSSVERPDGKRMSETCGVAFPLSWGGRPLAVRIGGAPNGAVVIIIAPDPYG
jgi:hypothetical protein